MARRIYLWLPGLTALAVFCACGGISDPGLFSPSGSGGSASQGGDGASAGTDSTPGGATSQAGSTGVAGDDAGGATSEGGASHGGASHGGASHGGASHGGHGGAENGGAGTAGAGQAGAGGSAGASGGSGGSAGSSGSAGTAGTGGDSCPELLTLASKQLAAARACNIAADSLQCTGKVTNPCGCQVPVERDDSAETKAYLATLKRLEKQHCAQACPAIACFPVTNAQCSASSGSSVGVCVASSVFPG